MEAFVMSDKCERVELLSLDNAVGHVGLELGVDDGSDVLGGLDRSGGPGVSDGPGGSGGPGGLDGPRG